MKKIVFKDSTELQITSIVAQNRYIGGQNKEFYIVTFKTEGLNFEQIKAIFHAQDNLQEFDIFTYTDVETDEGVVQQWVYQGTCVDINVLNKISYNIETNTYEVELTKLNELEIKLAQNESGLLELADLVSSLLI